MIATAHADSVVVFNEIMYHPATSEAKFEWVELHNQMAVNIDLSNWSFDGGIQFSFPEGTIIPARGYLTIAISPADLRSATGLTNILGPFTGRLSNAGDTIRLYNNSHRLMDEIDYGVDGDWPVGPDGSGVSLARIDEESATANPRNWTVSALTGGTPGKRNFALNPFEIATTVPVLPASSWRYYSADPAVDPAWNQHAFDDSTWASGQGLFQSGTVVPPAGDPEPIPSVFSTGVSDDGTRAAPGSQDLHYLLTQSAQPASPPPPRPATVIENHPAWLANDVSSSWIGVENPGTLNVAAGPYNYRTTFNVDGFDPAGAVLRLNLAADNRVTDVLLNGASLGISYVAFTSFSGDFIIKSGFKPGVNTLDFLTGNDSTSPNPAGFRARVSGTAPRQFPVKTALPLQTGPSYFRTRFIAPGLPSQTSIRLNAVIADGAVFYLNGAEALRVNMPSGPVTPSTPALSKVTNPAYTGPYILPSNTLLAGTNVLAVELHQAGGSTGERLFGASLSLTTTNVLVPPPVQLAFNEFSSGTDSNFWVELINFGSSSLSLEGIVLSKQGGNTNREYIFPAQTLAPGASLQLSSQTLGFTAQSGEILFLYSPGKASVLDGIVIKSKARGRMPDGTGAWWFPSVPTPGASNFFQLSRDVVINEIMCDPPGQDASGSWIELYNRSTNTVPLTGWHLSKDISFDFPDGTIIPGNGYLVLAKDISYMQTNYPGIRIAGAFSGKLKHSGGRLLLTDAAGNPANELVYFTGKPWPEYADGGGSSLELRDPWADNSKPEAWAASREQTRSVWTNYSYRGVAQNVLGPTMWHEFVLGLLDAGECLLDDLSVVETPSGTPVQLLQNGNFETGFSSWRPIGSHDQSRVEIDPDNPANHVLHLISTAPAGHLHNHLETTFANGRTVTDGKEYQISFRAKWIAGNNRLNTRLYFNRVANTVALPMPAQHGTPGAPNSRATGNIGPTFQNLSQSPIVPQSTESVTISVSASDPQGVEAMELRWSANGGAWKSVPMTGGSAASGPDYIRYSALIPAQPAETVVQFYVQAADQLGAISFYPAGGTNSRALYKVDEGTGLMPQLQLFRLLMTASDATQLHAPSNVMSSALKGATIVYNDRQVYYDAGIHLQSSERGRNDSQRVGFSLKFHPDDLFRGVQNTVTLDRSGGYAGVAGKQGEILLWQAATHAGGIFSLDCDLAQVLAPRSQENSTAMLRMSAFDGDYWDNQFANGGDGNVYTMELIYYPTTTTTGSPQAPKLPQPDDVINVEMKNWGDSPENYRWIFLQQNHADADDYSQIIALNKVFSLSGTALESQTTQLIDSDEWMRALAFKAFTGDGDTFTYGLNHNWKIYFRPGDGKALGLLWDMDFAFAQGTTYSFPGSGSANAYKVTLLPDNYRRYYNHLLDIMTKSVNAAYLAPWAAHFGELLGQDWSAAVNYLQQRANYIRTKLPLTTAFAITSNGGRNFSSSTGVAPLTGTAPLTVKDIQVNGVTYPVRWTSLTNWTLSVPLGDTVNLLTLRGLDNSGAPLISASDSITVTNTGPAAQKAVVINEWMADNSGPAGYIDPADSRYSDWFELYNPNNSPADLSGFSLTDTQSQLKKWIIPPGTVISPNGHLLVWADSQTNLNASGSALHASFKLDKSGSDIVLASPNGVIQHAISFGPQTAIVSQGFFPDGNTNSVISMPNWTPGSPNQAGPPPSPALAAAALVGNGSISIVAAIPPGRTCRVEFKDDLNAAVWTPLGNYSSGSQSTITVTDSPLKDSNRFYRVILLQ